MNKVVGLFRIAVTGFTFLFSINLAFAEPVKVLAEPLASYDAGLTFRLHCNVVYGEEFMVSAEAEAVLDSIVVEGQVVEPGNEVVRLQDYYIKHKKAMLLAEIEKNNAERVYYKKDLDRISQLRQSTLIDQSAIDKTTYYFNKALAHSHRLSVELADIDRKLSLLRITAPFTARVESVKALKGQKVTAGQPLLHLVAVNSKRLICDLPLNDFEHMKPLSLMSFGYKGTSLLDWQLTDKVDARSQAITLIFNLDPQLSADIFVNQHLAIVAVQKHSQIYQVPLDALRGQTGETSVQLIDKSNRIRSVAVEVLRTQGSKHLITGAVESQQWVVVKGGYNLTDGTEVQIHSDEMTGEQKL